MGKDYKLFTLNLTNCVYAIWVTNEIDLKFQCMKVWFDAKSVAEQFTLNDKLSKAKELKDKNFIYQNKNGTWEKLKQIRG